MKKLNKYSEDAKFTQQLNHLQGFIGLPNWNEPNPSHSQMHEFNRRQQSAQQPKIQAKRSGLFKRFYGLLKIVFCRTGMALVKLRKHDIERGAVKTTPEGCS